MNKPDGGDFAVARSESSSDFPADLRAPEVEE
jgi:hypothetical protein